jgi:SAM-dependent methyltransferase
MMRRWNERYGREGYVFGTRPNDYLVAQRHRFHAGMSALVPADGPGRNAVWLAEQGVDPLIVDLSEAGLDLARRLAAERGVEVRTECANLTEWAWPEGAFDLIASIYLQFPPDVRHRMHRSMVRALKPGGLVVLECFHFDQRDKGYTSGGPPTRDNLVDAAILTSDFAGCEMIELIETVTELDEGPSHRGPGAVVRMVAQKT